MKKTLMILISFGIILALSGCDTKAEKAAAEKKEYREKRQKDFKKPVDTSGANAITKLPF